MKKTLLITLCVIATAMIGIAGYIFFFGKKLDNKILIPYIAHQKPRIDPHVPSSVPIADKLDEVVFDGLFNISATPSGVIYEDGLGEFVSIDKNNIVTIRLKKNKKWHTSYNIVMKGKKILISDSTPSYFSAADLKFTLQRIRNLGSLSPDYILISQAIENFDFSGPSDNGEIQFKFRTDRIWKDPDIKEVLSFKILPQWSDPNAVEFRKGSGPYILAGEKEDVIFFYKNLDVETRISNLLLKPFIDNSTYTTELKNHNINVLLSTPFGCLSPILADTNEFFCKSNISTCFFALFMNTQRLSIAQRKALRGLINNERIMERFYKINTPQQRHITDYKGNIDNYKDYLNFSLFPSSSYYVEEKIITTPQQQEVPDFTVLPDTVRIQTCIDFDFKEELNTLVEILNDPSMFHGKIKATPVKNQELRAGMYDAVLVPVTGYRSNFLFDVYDLFLREPDFALYRINLRTMPTDKGGQMVDPLSLTADKNFFRLDLSGSGQELDQKRKLLEYIYGFMSTHEIGDKQVYAQFINQADQELALGCWLFSLPSLAYFSTQFDKQSIDLYGVASQLSTVKKWREHARK